MRHNRPGGNNSPDLSRRQFGMAICSCAVALVQPYTSATADTTAESNEMTLEASLHAALRQIDSPVCAEAAKRLLQTPPPNSADVTLHLRSAGITAEDTIPLAKALTGISDAQRQRLRSFSLSYNNIADDGATALAAALPVTLSELGLVGCSITDTGADALLQWATRARGLKLICIESNALSKETRDNFARLRHATPGLAIYI